jgi:hypothetical protein
MNPTTKNQVIDLLQWSTQEYEDRLFQTMYNWCQQYGKYPSVIQRLLANSQVNRWFLNEYHKCELEFLKIADVVPNKTTTLQNHYKSCTIQVFQVFPSALIENIKSNGEFSKILFMNYPPYYAN